MTAQLISGGIITHYGLFWSERDVYWAGPKRGAMLGRTKARLGRRGAPTLAEKTTQNDYGNYVGLYALYAGQDLLYIGEAGLEQKKTTLFKRLKQHRADALADRWDSFSWFGRMGSSGTVDVSKALAHLEAITIAIINPGYNRQSGAFKPATQVYQVPHEDSEGDIETKVERLADAIRQLQPPAGKASKKKAKK